MEDYRLAHPLYLDVQMMVSFLAFLQGGVYVSSEETTQREKSKEGKGSGGGKAKLPSLGALLGLEASVNAEFGGKVGETAEKKVARHHTAASLFNALYVNLSTDGKIRHIRDLGDLEHSTPGDLVELTGRYSGNPLEYTLAAFNQFLGYMEEISQGVDTQNQRASGARRSGNPKRRDEASGQQVDESLATVAEQYRGMENGFEIRMLRKMKDELENSPVHDVVLETDSAIRAVLTVSSEYYSSTVAEHLKSGDFTVLGKVTRVVKPGESINLSRRSVMGVMGKEADAVVQSMVDVPLFAGQARRSDRPTSSIANLAYGHLCVTAHPKVMANLICTGQSVSRALAACVRGRRTARGKRFPMRAKLPRTLV